jgi:hypothetical protein
VSAQDKEVKERPGRSNSSNTRTCPEVWEEAEDWTTLSLKAYCPYIVRDFWSYKERSLHLTDPEWEFFFGQTMFLCKISKYL